LKREVEEEGEQEAGSLALADSSLILITIIHNYFVYISTTVWRNMGSTKRSVVLLTGNSENNSFWKGRLLYIGFGNGYVDSRFYDILFRLGLALDVLLVNSIFNLWNG
jgi:hypothetical protein